MKRRPTTKAFIHPLLLVVSEAEVNRPQWPSRHAPDSLQNTTSATAGRITARSEAKGKRRKGHRAFLLLKVGLLARFK
jgi:hypothetical protein